MKSKIVKKKLKFIFSRILFIVFIIPNFVQYRKLLKEDCVQKGFFSGFFQDYSGVGFDDDYDYDEEDEMNEKADIDL